MDAFVPAYFPRNGWKSFPGRINCPISKHKAEDTSPDCRCRNLDGKLSISKKGHDGALIIPLINETVRAPQKKYSEDLARRPILNFGSIGFNISPAIIHSKINAVRVGNALLERRLKANSQGWAESCSRSFVCLCKKKKKKLKLFYVVISKLRGLIFPTRGAKRDIAKCKEAQFIKYLRCGDFSGQEFSSILTFIGGEKLFIGVQILL